MHIYHSTEIIYLNNTRYKQHVFVQSGLLFWKMRDWDNHHFMRITCVVIYKDPHFISLSRILAIDHRYTVSGIP